MVADVLYLTAIRGLVLLSAGVVATCAIAAPAPSTFQATAERAVAAAIPTWHGRSAKIVEYVDLTRPFSTRSPWALVVAVDPRARPDADGGESDPVVICLVNRAVPHCTELLGKLSSISSIAAAPVQAACAVRPCYKGSYGVLQAKVVHVARDGRRPRLLLAARSMDTPTGSGWVQVVVYRYDPEADRFRALFAQHTGGNNNQAAHYVEHGPLQGDEIVDYPTAHAPYVYWIEIYAPRGDGPYRRILRYRSATHYGDGNLLPVADSEMPNILRRLGLWKAGDPLPVPQPLPADCGRLVMIRGEEWCSNLCARFGSSPCTRITQAGKGTARDL